MFARDLREEGLIQAKGYLRGMQLLHPITEEEVIAVFLRGELDSGRYGAKLRGLLARDGRGEVDGATAAEHEPLAVALRATPPPPALIAVTTPAHESLVLVEGHVRLTVEWPGGVAPPGSRRSRREPLGSPGSCHPAVGRAACQWARSAGSRRCTLASIRLARGGWPRSRLYFFMAHRTR